MGLVVNTNIAALTNQANLSLTNVENASALERLSSGLRLNSAADDPSGLSISTRLQSQIGGTDVAIRNANDGISLAQTAEGALDSIEENLLALRELAVQSANGTNSDGNRAALQSQVTELQQAIQSIAESASFNGINLLDGSRSEVNIQAGSEVGNVVSFNLVETTADSLGVASGAGISGTPPAGSVAPAGLEAGDLVINGVAVPQSLGIVDTASVAFAEASAISVAAAINSVSDTSGVSAVVNANALAGSAFTPSTQNGAIVLNGVSIDVATDADLSASANLTNVANALNEASEQTGVTAVFDGNPNAGITLIAEDGRNIALENGAALNTADIGLASGGAPGAPVVFTGAVTLVSADGSPISLSTDTGNIDNAGFEVGTFSGTSSGVVSDNLSGVALQSGDLTINGVDVGPTLASADTASVAGNDASAIALAAAINGVSDVTGVRAEANATRVDSAAISATGPAQGSVTINGVQVDLAFPASAGVSDRLSGTISAINAVSGQTGVRAEELDGDQFILVADDGRNITLAPGAGDTSGNASLGFDLGGAVALQNVGSVSLVSGSEITLGSDTGNIANAGFSVGTFGNAETGASISALDISTSEGAVEAIAAVDNALRTLAFQRVEIGQAQTRLETAIGNLSTLSINLTASNSQIIDADFAQETAALSRSSVLQSAGISVLAQANAVPNTVLSLLPQ